MTYLDPFNLNGLRVDATCEGGRPTSPTTNLADSSATFGDDGRPLAQRHGDSDGEGTPLQDTGTASIISSERQELSEIPNGSYRAAGQLAADCSPDGQIASHRPTIFADGELYAIGDGSQTRNLARKEPDQTESLRRLGASDSSALENDRIGGWRHSHESAASAYKNPYRCPTDDLYRAAREFIVAARQPRLPAWSTESSIAYQTGTTIQTYDIIASPLEACPLVEDGDPKAPAHILTSGVAASSSPQKSLRYTPLRRFNHLARDFIPIDQRFRHISCAIKVGRRRAFGNPFDSNDTACALFSADVRLEDMPCIRLEFDFNQILKPPFDFNDIPLSKLGIQAAYTRITAAGPSPPADLLGKGTFRGESSCTEFGYPFVPLTLRWYRGSMIDYLGYRRVVNSPGNRPGDSEIIRLCPEGRLMERLIRMTWVSTFPMLWPEKCKIRRKLAPVLEANLSALLGNDQPKEITIWFLNPWGLDATNLQELVFSYSRRCPM